MSDAWFTVVPTPDPITGNYSIKGARYIYKGSDATNQPTFVKNTGNLRGTVLAVVFNYPDQSRRIHGSAFIIAPGLAVSAKHVFDDDFGELRAGRISAYLMGLDETRGTLWRVTEIIANEGDVVLLLISASSALPPDNLYHHLAVTTRAPSVGETLEIVGFQAGKEWTKEDSMSLECYVAKGVVSAFYFNGRDKFLLPYPSIEIQSGSLGGMSGGIAIDANGYVMGVISRGWTTEDRLGPTYIAWIVPYLVNEVTITWPPHIYKPDTPVVQLEEPLIMIEGRDKLTVLNQNDYVYTVWF